MILKNDRIPVAGNYDVVVVGGGIAGVSAALAAKRNGCSVLIIEKSIVFGGLATLGLIVHYLPLCDGKGRKVTGGIAEELLYLSIKYGYDTLPDEWRGITGSYVNTDKRYRTYYNAPAFILGLDEIMEVEGIHILFDTVFCDVLMEDGFCKGVIVESKAGRMCYYGKVVVDATGDAEAMGKAGAKCVDGENIPAQWAYTTSLDTLEKAVKSKNIGDSVEVFKLFVSNTLGVDIEQLQKNPVAEKYNGNDPEYITQFTLNGRRFMREMISRIPKNEKCILSLPGMPLFRKIRRIEGYHVLDEKDMFVHFEDSIGCVGDFRKAGPIYEVPYRILIAERITNMITAGRSVSADGEGWEVMRVIPSVSLTGQAAGTAAAIAVEESIRLEEVPILKLQERLTKSGVLIHF